MNTAEQSEMFETVRFTAAERKVFRRKERLPLSQYAEKHRRVTMGAHVGPWRNEITPYLAFIMDLYNLPHVREMIICKSPQGGGTNFIYNAIAQDVDEDPSNAVIVMPDQNMTRRVMEDRIIPMFRQSPRLSALISSNPDDTAKQRVALNNGAKLYGAWANSAATLATFPIKKLYLDEVDKYPLAVGKETDPITLAKKRQRTFPHTSKMIEVSTPTREDGPIWVDLKAAEVEYHFYACCPACSHEQTFKFSQLRWPEDTKSTVIRREALARYECEDCKEQWTDRMRDMSVRTGSWKTVRGKDILKPRTIGAHMPSYLFPDVSLSEIAESFLLAKNSKTKLIDHYNDYRAEPFIESEVGETVDYEMLYNRREDYAPKDADWQVPMNACVLSFFVDVQKNRLEVETVAWGPGFESWGLDYRALPGDPKIQIGYEGSPWNDLAEYIKRTWKHESGVLLRPVTGGIDSGYLSREVYRFTRKRKSRKVYATKGSSTHGKSLITVSKPKDSDKNIKDRFKVTIINIGTELAKDMVYENAEVEGGGPGFMHYHKGYGLDYFKQFCAEKAVTKYDRGGRPYTMWVKIDEHAPNEALDLRVGNLAMIEMLNPNFEALSEGLKKQAEELKGVNSDSKKETGAKGSRGKKGGGFVNNW